jgi:hypothetical protein
MLDEAVDGFGSGKGASGSGAQGGLTGLDRGQVTAAGVLDRLLDFGVGGDGSIERSRLSMEKMPI